MQPGLRRAQGDAEGRRHVGQRHPQQVVQRDDRAVPGIQAPEGEVHELPVGQRAGMVDGGGGVDGVQLDLDRAPASAPGEIEAGVDGQAMDPGVEPLGIAKSRQVAPGPDQRLLDGVARELRVPEDQAGRRVQPRKRRVDELGEGVMIALPRAFDEHSLVHGDLAEPRPWRSRSSAYGVVQRGIVHGHPRPFAPSPVVAGHRHVCGTRHRSGRCARSSGHLCHE